MSKGTTPECDYIGGHAEGFDSECWWCGERRRKTDMADLNVRAALGEPDQMRWPTPNEWAAFVRVYLA